MESMEGSSRKAAAQKSEHDAAKPTLLLFGKDSSVEDIVAAINAESRRQAKTARRMVRVKKA